MSANILDAIQDLATPAMIKAATQTLGVSESHATSGLAAAATSVLGGLLQHSGDASVMAKVAGLAGSVTPDANMFANLSTILTGGVATSPIHMLGNKLLGLIFGDKMAGMISAVASATGVTSRASAGLASLAAPMVLAALRSRLGAAPTAATLTSLLNADKGLIAGAMPPSLRSMYGLADFAPAAAAAVAAAAPAVAAAVPPAPAAATVAPSVAATVAPSAAATVASVAPLAPAAPIAPAAPLSSAVRVAPAVHAGPAALVAQAAPAAPAAPAVVTAPVAAAAAAVAAAAATAAPKATAPSAHSASGYASAAVTTAPSAASTSAAIPAAPVHAAPVTPAPVPAAVAAAPAAAAVHAAPASVKVATSAGNLPPHVAAATHVATPQDEGTKLPVLLAFLIPVALATALIWYWAYGTQPVAVPAAPKAAAVVPATPAPAAPKAAAVAPAPAPAPVAAPAPAPVSAQLVPVAGENGMVKYTLPGGAVIEVAKDGLESQLLGFINNKDAAIDKGKWFDFDRLHFVTASSELTPESKVQVATAVAILKAYPAVNVKIGGYTDNQGDADANLKLSDKRAKRVAEEFTAGGIEASRVESEGYGEAHPVGDNATPEGRAKNRRTSLSVRAK